MGTGASLQGMPIQAMSSDHRRREEQALCREDQLGEEEGEEELYREMREEITGEPALLLSEEQRLEAELLVQASGDQAP